MTIRHISRTSGSVVTLSQPVRICVDGGVMQWWWKEKEM